MYKKKEKKEQRSSLETFEISVPNKYLLRLAKQQCWSYYNTTSERNHAFFTGISCFPHVVLTVYNIVN